MTEPPDTGAVDQPRDVWRDLAWGVSRGVALACLPLLVNVLLGRLPVSAGDPRMVHGSDAGLAILALGAGLGVVAGLFRPLTRWLPGSLALGVLLAEAALLLVRSLVPARSDAPIFHPLGQVLVLGLLLGLALYLGELHRRTDRSSLAS